jgi:tetratricopeptide (TPR) repeat protein
MRSRLVPLLVFIALAGATFGTARRLAVPDERPYDVELVPSAQVLRVASLGHPTLAANLYWLRAVQYVGEPRANERGWDRLFPLVNLVTELDPAHGYAYQVAGTLLGTVGHVEESNRILEKGMREVPTRYILPFLRAFNAFYYEGDYAKAGEFIEVAARVPGAPPRLRDHVLAMYVKGRRADAAVAFLLEMRRSATDEESIAAIDGQLKQAALERDAALLEDAIRRYRETRFFGPYAVGQLALEGVVPAIPPDPYGGAWVLGDDGRVRSSANAFRYAPPESAEQRLPEPGVDPRIYGGMVR